MPGHKGKSFLGSEKLDITEIAGADSLYGADGIILKSEKNAAKLFGTRKTLYSTEGSSQCIRAMLFLAKLNQNNKKRPVIVAARNAHKAFITAAALLDFDIIWLYPENENYSLCKCEISAAVLEKTLISLKEPPCAVYITSPDYLGGTADIKSLAAAAHKFNTLLLVDNAHGAYLHFIKSDVHPMDCGADICCDSAHKTLPVLTGGAYLHIAKNTNDLIAANSRRALAMFGSTSPSYLILQSLDLANKYIANGYSKKLTKTINKLNSLKSDIKKMGFTVEKSDPLKLTVNTAESGLSGTKFSQLLREKNIEIEYADPDFAVMMFTPENDENDFEKTANAFSFVKDYLSENRAENEQEQHRSSAIKNIKTEPLERYCTVREAMLCASETVLVENAVGRVAASPAASCPPAVPIAVSGEIISENTVEILKYYGFKTVEVMVTYPACAM